MEPSPDLHYASSALDSPNNNMGNISSGSKSPVREPLASCDCPILGRLQTLEGASDWRVDELIRVPASAHGYMDPESGKQTGSFITYIINFCVRL